MNYYIRYFDNEEFVYSIDEAIEFLSSIDEIEITEQMIAELKEYSTNDIFYPKRYKVHSRAYFIVIKTEAQNMQDFKDKKALHPTDGTKRIPVEQVKLVQAKTGWYEGTLTFKRVITNQNGKCEYKDTEFIAQCIADSPQNCYDKIVEHLASRVDKRSQFPAAKGKYFKYKFLGLTKENN